MDRLYLGVKCLAVLGTALCLCLLLLDARALVKAQFGAAQRESAKYRELADAHARQVEQDLRLRLDAALAEIHSAHEDANSQLTALRTETLAEVGQIRETADQRVGDTLARVDTALAETKPVMENAASITAHADEAAAILFRRDALPAQVLGVLGATKVTMGETAQTMKTVRDAAPAIAESVKGVADSAKDIAADAKLEADVITKPKHWYQKVFGPVFDTLRLVAAFI